MKARHNNNNKILRSYTPRDLLRRSVFGPNTIYSLRWIRLHEEVPLTQFPHLIGPILGGIFAGKVMNAAFPDD